MITTRLYLDTRGIGKRPDASLKVTITRKGKVAMINTGIRIQVACWDSKAQKITNHPRANSLNLT